MKPNKEGDTRIDEIANGIYRISTPVPPKVIPGGFTFNQYLIVDDAPLLYHTGPRKMFPLVRDAIASVIPVRSLRYIGFSHYESDECGSLNDFLEAAPNAEPLCSTIAKMVSVDDIALRPAHALSDGEELSLGAHVVRWIDTPTYRTPGSVVTCLRIRQKRSSALYWCSRPQSSARLAVQATALAGRAERRRWGCTGTWR